MRIELFNASEGNSAMAAVLLLYYHLVLEGGITHDQTVYLNPNDLDPAVWITVEVDSDLQPEIDQTLIREGAVVRLLCDLKDMIDDFDEAFALQPFTKKLLTTNRTAVLAAVPEAEQIFALLENCRGAPNYSVLREGLAGIFERYVRRRFLALALARPTQ